MPTFFERLSHDVFVIHGLLSPATCAAEIMRAESIGYTDAPVTTPAGPVMMPTVRSNSRVMIDDPIRASGLWTQLVPWMPDAWMTPEVRRARWHACGLNERLRMYRYDPGEAFALHRDGSFERDEDERSMLTVLIYLSDGFDGGNTNIMDHGQIHQIVPRRGMALVFAHELPHEGAALISGRKYVLRTDVMYRRG